MNYKEQDSSFWSRPVVRWTASVLLGIIFILAFVVFLAADLVSRDLLDPDLYANALEEEDIYNRIYTDLLADPAMVEATALMLGNLNLDPSLSTNILSFASSTLYLVLPPSTIQSAAEGAINGATAYFSGETDELQAVLFPKGLDPEEIASKMLDGILALTGQLFAEAQPELPSELTELVQEELVAYSAEIAAGNVGPVPAKVAAVSLENVTAEQRAVLSDVLLSQAADTPPSELLFQIDAALRANDLPSALTLAGRELLRARVEESAAELVDLFANSEAMDALVSTANLLGQTEAELAENLNSIRSVIIFLDGVAVPLTLAVMVLSLAAIVWIHTGNLIELLRTTGATLVITSSILALIWIVLGLLIRNSLESRFAASSELPPSLENMISDVVSNLSSTIWQNVWQTATIPLVLGLALLILSFLPGLQPRVERWLEPVGRYSKLVILGGVLAIVLVPIFLQFLIKEIREPDLVCNGHAALCDRPVNEVAFATTHNAMSIADYGWIWPSHDGSVSNQLNAGVRGFLIDTHYWDDQAWIESHLDEVPPEVAAAVKDILDTVELGQEDGLYLCHMMCSLGATELAETLGEINIFLENNPNDIVAIIFEDLISTADTELAFTESGLADLVFTYEPGSPWPTLEEMIEQDRRVLVMAEAAGPPPDWYLHAWDYTEETPYSFSELADFDDTSCEPNRGDTGKPFFLFNHWITRASPSRVDAAVLNEYDYLMERATRCAEERGQIPNFVGINFYLNGDVFEVVDELNGVRQVSE